MHKIKNNYIYLLALGGYQGNIYASGVSPELARVMLLYYFWPGIIFFVLIFIGILKSIKNTKSKNLYLLALIMLGVQIIWYLYVSNKQ